MNEDRGQAIVEFALVVPLLLVLILGVVLVAEIGVARLALEHAAAEAARTGALTNDDELIRSTAAAAVTPLDASLVKVLIEPTQNEGSRSSTPEAPAPCPASLRHPVPLGCVVCPADRRGRSCASGRVDALSDQRGQATLAIVFALAIAASAVIGLRAAQERIVADARAQRAGEAAVEAAAQSVADLYALRPAAAKELVVDPRIVENARVAAEELARENGGRSVEQVRLLCDGPRIEARLVLAGTPHAGFSAPNAPCPSCSGDDRVPDADSFLAPRLDVLSHRALTLLARPCDSLMSRLRVNLWRSVFRSRHGPSRYRRGGSPHPWRRFEAATASTFSPCGAAIGRSPWP